MDSVLPMFLGTFALMGVALYLFYWIIRLAVKHGVESQQRKSHLTASGKRYRGGVPPLFSWRKTMKEMNHFGVYGVCIREGRILCIRKTRGPYRGRFDLPGGTPEEGESFGRKH